MSLRTSIGVVVLLLLSLTTVAWGQSKAGSHLDRARSDWDSQEYEAVVSHADAALRSRASRAQTIEALRLKGASFAVLGNDEDAARSFTRILDLDANYQLPEKTSPRILAVFRPTRSKWELARETELRERLGADLAAVKFEVTWPVTSRGGRAMQVDVRLHDPKKLVSEVLLFYRRKGQRSYSSLRALPEAAPFPVQIPAALTTSKTDYQLEAFALAVHKTGVPLRRVAAREKPFALAVAAGSVPKPAPVYKRWWFIASAGAMAIALPFLIDQAVDVGPQKVRGSLAP